MPGTTSAGGESHRCRLKSSEVLVGGTVPTPGRRLQSDLFRPTGVSERRQFKPGPNEPGRGPLGLPVPRLAFVEICVCRDLRLSRFALADGRRVDLLSATPGFVLNGVWPVWLFGRPAKSQTKRHDQRLLAPFQDKAEIGRYRFCARRVGTYTFGGLSRRLAHVGGQLKILQLNRSDFPPTLSFLVHSRGSSRPNLAD